MPALDLLVPLLSYGVSMGISPRLPTGRRVTPIGALGPALIALGPAGYGVASVPAMVLGVFVVEQAAGVAQRQKLDLWVSLRHTTLFAACAWLFSLLAEALWHGNPVSAGAGRLLIAVALSSLVFPLGDALGRGAARALRYHAPVLPLIREELRTGVLLHLVFVSTAGLVALSFSDLGPVAFVILLLPLLATHLGFARFATARKTYTDTVRALGGLTEAAGYAPEGHHARVADLSVATARELGLWGDRVSMLELVALVHDVGNVSVPEPSDISRVDPAVVAHAGRRVLEETGYLAGQARLLADLASPPHEAAPVDARILRVVSAYDELACRQPDALARLERITAPEDLRVLGALKRVLARRA